MLTFVANRNDGIGARLGALLNAIIVSDLSGGRFSFSWGKIPGNYAHHHAIAPVEKTFAPEFIREHHVADDFLKSNRIVLLKEICSELAKGCLVLDPKVAISVSHVALEGQAKPLIPHLKPEFGYAEAFKAISFSEELEAARNYADDIQLPRHPVALHLRAGDIIYGKFRFTDFFSGKVCPFPLADRLVSDLVDRDQTPILFGQDRGLLLYLKERFGALVACEFVEGRQYTASQEAMFDICLMARCSEIYSGSSYFSVLASRIGNRSRVDPRRVYGADEAVEIIENKVFGAHSTREVSELQSAFACRAACLMAKQDVPKEDRFRRLMERARTLDPENSLYHVAHACGLYDVRESERAERVLYDVLVGGGSLKGPQNMVLTAVRGNSMQDRTIAAYLRSVADEQWPMAALCVAISENALKRPAPARQYFSMFEARRPDKWAALGQKVLAAFPELGGGNPRKPQVAATQETTR